MLPNNLLARYKQNPTFSLADRLGIWALKSQFEDLSFQYIYPDKFQEITDQLASYEEERKRYIDQHIIPDITEALAIFDIQAKISGRAKHVYSIHRKMEAKQLSFEQLNDVLGVRIIVNTREECYKAQAILHTLWTPLTIPYEGMAGRDWIDKPKENNYQSLHTTVLMDGKEVEIQIRTPHMHEVAESGLAAHWRYKAPKTYSKGKTTFIIKEKEQAWTEQLLSLRQQLENTNTEEPPVSHSVTAKRRIYVITPVGHVIDLTAGATPLDFAYRIHTTLGHAYNGAKVGDRIVRMEYRLQNGDIVELLPPRTNKRGPSSEWLLKSRDENGKSNYIYARTSQARSKIKQWFHANKQPLL